MKHVHHMAKQKRVLDIRWNTIRLIREFFWQQQFTEVETPHLLATAGMEPYLDPMQVSVMNQHKDAYTAYLHTSPEYTMKKLLAAGYTSIFSLGKCYRNIESFGGDHNPEFTMLEWYRSGVDMYALMDDIDALSTHLEGIEEPRRIHMNALWQETIGVTLDDHLLEGQMRDLCKEKGYAVSEDEPYEDLFYRIFLNEIEPRLKDMGSIIVHHFPMQMAALAAKSDIHRGYAERFEWYIHGKEIANAFTELTDAKEQTARFKTEQQRRKALNKTVFPIDTEFIAAVDQLDSCAGIALGVDRLVMVVAGCQNIDDVLPLPASIQFEA
ncbi:MAG: EF-P lysine aminoacylase GenX [Candidatus Magasanikbacteria bacterium]|nr:EF-P lysine aminoacylase GenX [Candidatus Magasanikbacteria bacterium]